MTINGKFQEENTGRICKSINCSDLKMCAYGMKFATIYIKIMSIYRARNE